MNDDPNSPLLIPVTAVDAPASTGIRRRAALQTLLGTAAAGFALPAVASRIASKLSVHCRP